MTLPHLSRDDKIKALKKAQEMRSKRAELRAKLKMGSLTLREVLDASHDEVVSKMRAAYLIESLPQIGKVTARKIMEEIGINENRRVQGLGKRQVSALIARLG